MTILGIVFLVIGVYLILDSSKKIMGGGLRLSSHFVSRYLHRLLWKGGVIYDSFYNPIRHVSGGDFGDDCYLRSKQSCLHHPVR